MKTHVLSELGRRTEEPPICWLMATALARPVKKVSRVLKAFFSLNQ